MTTNSRSSDEKLTGGERRTVPRRAVVLAAGLGQRLRPLTNGCPKPLLPLWGVPLLERTLRLLEEWGVTEIAVNTHWQAEQINAFVARRKGRARITLSYEPEILGTGGALRPLRQFLGSDPFWLMNADIAVKVAPEPLFECFARQECLGVAWLEPKCGPCTVEADRQGRITCYRSPTPGVASTYTFCGVQLLTPEIFEYLPAQPYSSVVEAYESAMMRERFMRGVVVPGSAWDDAGTLEAYLRLHGAGECVKWGIKPPTGAAPWVSGAAQVAEGVRGKRSVVYGTARILADSILDSCVISGGVVGGKLTNLVCVPAAEVDAVAVPLLLKQMGWRGTECAAHFLGARGSNRSFWRLYHHHATAILVRYSLERPENGHYAARARLLSAAGVSVPRVLAESAARHALVLEDWGANSLEEHVKAKPMQMERWYTRVVKALAHLHTQATRYVLESGAQLEQPFDAALYAWERTLFGEHLLAARYGIEAWPEGVEQELLTVAAALEGSRQVVLHRDFQSSNILLRGKEFAIIDFQGMRLGAPAYDLASLLYDPYVTLPQPLRETLATLYCAQHPQLSEARELLHEGAVQRLIQALGAFGRLTASGQSHFASYIMSALENLLYVADECDLDALGALAEELIAREGKLALYGGVQSGGLQ